MDILNAVSLQVLSFIALTFLVYRFEKSQIIGESNFWFASGIGAGMLTGVLLCIHLAVMFWSLTPIESMFSKADASSGVMMLTNLIVPMAVWIFIHFWADRKNEKLRSPNAQFSIAR